jgi:pimeloyl-ACP methyl ester carboxylesterase
MKIAHRRTTVNGIDVFYREAGPADAPVLLLPHGYPCSSFQFRNLMPALADRWRTVAPDFPGFGYSATPAGFPYTFDAHAAFLQDFVTTLGLDRYVIWLHDYGSQHGLRLAMARPERVAGLIIQNGDIYEDRHGPKYAPLKEFWDNPTPEGRAKLAAAVSLDGFRDEFRGEVPAEVAERISPDLWTLSWAQLNTPERREHLTTLLADQRNTRTWFGRQQAYLREHRPPTLIVWGPEDGYMPAGAAEAYRRDLPDAELHLFDGGGHWLLETHLAEVLDVVRPFLDRVR